MDRIDDAYNGLMGEEFMRKTRERLHWICSQVNGERILDVGCSQGTMSRLLASMGKSITGLDINKDAIAYAEGKAAELDSGARGRLCYQAVNFADFNSSELFDTVVMGEILEHLAAPALFVGKAHSLLKPGGTFVVTVPFGINDDPDHRQTFYWTWIKEIVEPFFDVVEMRIFGKWIGVTGKRRERKIAIEKSVPLSAVKELEAAFYGLERPLVNDCKSRGLKLQAQRKDIDETRKALASRTAEKKAGDESAARQKVVLDAEIAKQKAAVVAEQAKVKAAETRLLECSQEVRDLRTALDARHDEAVESAERLGRMSGQIEALRGERDAARASCVAAQTQCDAFKAEKERLLSRLSEVEASLADAEEKVAENAQKAENAEEVSGRLKAQCDGYEREIEKVASERDAANTALAKAQTELANAKAALTKAQAECSSLKAGLQKKDADLSYAEQKLASETARRRQLSKKSSRAEKSVAKLEKRYSALARSKLGRLTLRWWKVKDRILGRSGGKGVAKASSSPGVKVPKSPQVSLPVETWAQQRENERRYFAK
ncbi:MAG: methyltransferase domain-containing protein [Kiritimatiellae bacterium]|nr:methyltransferase domain-containing protein [Kiritimatiellia bacterium]